MTYIRSLCVTCKHLYPKKKREDNNTCKAFPKGIPNIIRFFEHDHKTPIEGDNGIQYEPKEKQ